jgi:hypothetical protein
MQVMRARTTPIRLDCLAALNRNPDVLDPAACNPAIQFLKIKLELSGSFPKVFQGFFELPE